MAPRYSQKTLRGLIAVEGLDGAGTSTQSGLLVRALNREGVPAVATAEPTNGPVGMLIRMILRDRLRAAESRERTDELLAHLFASDRHDHLYNATDGMESMIRGGKTVVTTRYYFSSYAYNARSEDEFALIDRLNQEFPLPQIVVFLQVPIAVSLERLGQRDKLELYEKEEELRRVAANYERLFEPIRDRVLRYDCTRGVEEVGRDVARDVLSRLT